MNMQNYRVFMEAIQLYGKLKIIVNRAVVKGFWTSPQTIHDDLLEHIFKYVVTIFYKGIVKKPRINSKIINFLYGMLAQKSIFELNYEVYDKLSEAKCKIEEEEAFFISTLMEEKISRVNIWKYISKHQGKIISSVPEYYISVVEKDIEENSNDSREILEIIKHIGMITASIGVTSYEDKMTFVTGYTNYLKSILDLNDIKELEFENKIIYDSNLEGWETNLVDMSQTNIEKLSISDTESDEIKVEKLWEDTALEEFDINPYREIMRTQEKRAQKQKAMNEWLKDGDKVIETSEPKEFINNEVLSLVQDINSKNNNKTNREESEDLQIKENIAKMEAIVGIGTVKEEMLFLIDLIKVNRWRKKNGLLVKPIPRKFLFSGNEGLGKLRIAEVISQIYSKTGILSISNIVNVNFEDVFSAENEGKPYNERLENALANSRGSTFYIRANIACESVELLEKFGHKILEISNKIEEKQDEFVLIIVVNLDSGPVFEEKMKEIGMEFDRKFTFDNYTYNEMIDIIDKMSREGGYVINTEAKIYLYRQLKENKAEEIDNVNKVNETLKALLDKAVIKQISRLAQFSDMERESLVILTKSDFES